MTTEDTLSPREFKDRRAWRAWLEKNHGKEEALWLLFYKAHVEKKHLTLPEALEEALCFGWIDGKLRRIDDEKHMVRFTPRKAKSPWSKSNKARVEKLIASGAMTEAGLLAIEAAKKNGAWERAELDPLDDEVPDLEAALDKDKEARRHYDAFPPSTRRQYVAWVSGAKTEATRRRHVVEVVRRSKANLRPGEPG